MSPSEILRAIGADGPGREEAFRELLAFLRRLAAGIPLGRRDEVISDVAFVLLGKSAGGPLPVAENGDVACESYVSKAVWRRYFSIFRKDIRRFVPMDEARNRQEGEGPEQRGPRLADRTEEVEFEGGSVADGEPIEGANEGTPTSDGRQGHPYSLGTDPFVEGAEAREEQDEWSRRRREIWGLLDETYAALEASRAARYKVALRQSWDQVKRLTLGKTTMEAILAGEEGVTAASPSGERKRALGRIYKAHQRLRDGLREAGDVLLARKRLTKRDHDLLVKTLAALINLRQGTEP